MEFTVPLPDADLGKPQGSILARGLDGVLRATIGLAIFGELLAVFLNVVLRFGFSTSLIWVDDVAKIALAVIAFLGGAYSYRRDEHVAIDFVVMRLPARVRVGCHAFRELLILGTAAVIVVSAIQLAIVRWNEIMPALQVPAGWVVIPLVAGAATLAITAIERLARLQIATVAIVTALCLVAGAAIASATSQGLLSEDGTIGVELIAFFLCVLLGVPVGFALIAASVLFLYTAQAAPMVALPQNMVDGVSSFILLAIPFFIFAGVVMERGGLSRRLVRLIQAAVGHFRGGLLQVMVISMYLVSGMSGSKVADVAAVGSVLRSMLRSEGYAMEEGTAVLAGSAIMGETIPPSIAMLVLGSISSLSMASLFAAGLIPAAVLAACLMVLVYLRALRSGMASASRAGRREVMAAAIGAVAPALMPGLIIVGILSGIATPTEVSSFVVIYGLVLALGRYREMRAADVMSTAIDAAATSGMILFILGAATAFSWTLTISYLPQRLVELLATDAIGTPVFLIGCVTALVILGSLLEGLPALLVMAPLLLPVAVERGISALHFSIVLLIAMAIGAFAPPIGAGFYVACGVLGTSVEQSARSFLPYLLILCVGLTLVVLVPWFTLAVPAAFGLALE